MIRIFKNFFYNFGNIFRKPETVNYPKDKIIVPEESKGMVHLKLDLDNLECICDACGRCQLVCPKNCLEVKKGIDGEGREVLQHILIDIGKCIFCGNCVEYCKLEAIEMSYRYQLAEYGRESLKFEKDDLIKQADYKIRDFWSK